MATPILNGAMSANITAFQPTNIEGKRRIQVTITWGATGSPNGIWGLKLGGDKARMVDMGSITSGRFSFIGSQPSGVAAAGSLVVELETGAAYIDVYYTFSSGGAANTSATVDITGNP